MRDEVFIACSEGFYTKVMSATLRPRSQGGCRDVFTTHDILQQGKSFNSPQIYVAAKRY